MEGSYLEVHCGELSTEQANAGGQEGMVMEQPCCGASDRRGRPHNWGCWGPFGSNMAQLAIEDNQGSIGPNVVLDTASIEPADAQPDFIMLGAKNGGGNGNGDNAQGHGGGNSSPGRGGTRRPLRGGSSLAALALKGNPKAIPTGTSTTAPTSRGPGGIYTADQGGNNGCGND
jgi:hypothetical protein